MSDNFYDEDWKKLLRRYPIVAKKIEALRCETVNYQEFEELREKIGKLENKAPKDDYKENDFERLFWKELQGTKGSFQRTNKIANNNSKVFQALQAILKEKNGFCLIGDYNFWFDNNDPDIIDRRKK